jgi:AmmeMemoRadiSam system protein B
MKRKLRFDGSWYPSDLEELEQLIKVIPSLDNEDVFGVVPHAGLYYSSSLIKLFFNTLKPEVNKMLLITPSHYYALEDDVVGGGNIDSFDCSLGNIPGFTIASLQSGYEKVTEAEHAVEMILPFITQRQDMSLCCAHVNRFTDVGVASKYAKMLLSEIDDKTAVVASSDFTHYGNNFRYTPYGSIVDDDLVDKVSAYDRDMANRFASGDGKTAYLKATGRDKATICGIAPMLLVSEMARLNNMKGRILGQSNSIKGRIKDKDFVSYLSIAWRK